LFGLILTKTEKTFLLLSSLIGFGIVVMMILKQAWYPPATTPHHDVLSTFAKENIKNIHPWPSKSVFFVFPDLAATHVVRIGVDGRGYASIRLGQRTTIANAERHSRQ
jgi:hypothetical protein